MQNKETPTIEMIEENILSALREKHKTDLIFDKMFLVEYLFNIMKTKYNVIDNTMFFSGKHGIIQIDLYKGVI